MDHDGERAARGPLWGTRVIELGDFVTGPCCAMMLADLDSQVIKVEPPPSGDSSRRYGPFVDAKDALDVSGLYQYLNVNKLGVTLNLNTDMGRQLLGSLVAISDVLICNLPHREMVDLQLDYQRLNALNPQLIVVAITAFGISGPRSHWKAHDITLTAASGFSAAVGLPEGEPLGFPGPVAQFNAGMYAAAATLAALCVRDLHGFGQLVDISEVDSLATLHTGEEGLMWVHDWRVTQRMGHSTQAGSGFASHEFRCKDGQVFLDAARNAQWRRLVSMTGREEFVQDPRFQEVAQIDGPGWEEAKDYLEDWMSSYTREELLELDLRHQLGITPNWNVGEMSGEPGLAGSFRELVANGKAVLRGPGLPYSFADWQQPAPAPAPKLGEHNGRVYGDILGIRQDELTRMFQAGVI